MIDGETRKYAAILARRHFAGTVTAVAMFEHFGASDDPLIRELLLAILHEPQRGFFGVRESRWRRSFWTPVSQLLDELEKGDDGHVPAESALPRVTAWTLIGLALFIIWTGTTAARHALALWRGEGQPWEWFVHALGTVIMTVAAAAAVMLLRGRLMLRRIRQTMRSGSNNAG